MKLEKKREKLVGDGERTFYLVGEFSAHGLTCRVHQGVPSEEVKKIAPSVHDWYMGYVRIPEGDETNYSNSDDIEVHGGVTFEGGFTQVFGIEGKWVGFDMAHWGDEKIPNPKDYAIEQTIKLAMQVRKRADEQKLEI